MCRPALTEFPRAPCIASATRSATNCRNSGRPGFDASQCIAAICASRQPDEAVAAFQRVIEEGEFVVARQRREPERQLGEIDGARVLVDAVEAALRDEPAGMQLLVLVRGNAWPRLGPARPGLAPAARRARGRPRPGRRPSPSPDRRP